MSEPKPPNYVADLSICVIAANRSRNGKTLNLLACFSRRHRKASSRSRISCVLPPFQVGCIASLQLSDAVYRRRQRLVVLDRRHVGRWIRALGQVANKDALPVNVLYAWRT